MIILQCSDEFDKIVEFEHLSNKNFFYSKKVNIEKKSAKTQGFYSFVNSIFMALFKFNDYLYFRANELYLRIDNQTSATLELNDNLNEFSIFSKNESIFSLKYKSKEIKPNLEQDILSFLVEKEDFDFCLFLNNIINNPERKRLFLENN